MKMFYESSIYNIVFSSEKVVSSESGEKYALIKHCLQMKTVLNKCIYDMRFKILMREDNRRFTFSLEEALLWIVDSYLRQR